MGVVGSKSPLERRNTVARRSQRRSLFSLKPKVEQIHKEIKKFKGVTEDTKWVAIKNEIGHLKHDMSRRAKDLQPQIRNLYETIYKRLAEADEALDKKLKENQEKEEKKAANSSVAPASTVAESEVLSDVTEPETVTDIHQETEEKRKTVEINLVKVISPPDSPKSPNTFRIISPAEKRKSILKVGVPVMPGALMNEFNNTNRITTKNQSKTVQDTAERIQEIIETVRDIEIEINEFVGQRNGKHYTKIRDSLNTYMIELNTLSPMDDYALEQLKVCRNFIGSCLSFLDERATTDLTEPESFSSDEEVFVNNINNNNNAAVTKVEANFKLQKLLKNTAV